MKNFTYTTLAILLTTLNVNAATIDISTRYITNGINNSDFINSWNSQSSPITTSSISDFNNFSSGKNSISHLSVNFNTNQAGTWGFEAGLDAHYGAALYIDNTLIGNRTDDLWWSHNWNNSDVMSQLNILISAGVHTLDMYWAESCCNGSSSARFTTDNTNWQSLSTTNLGAYASTSSNNNVPEPMTITLLGLGLVGLISTHGKAQKYI